VVVSGRKWSVLLAEWDHNGYVRMDLWLFLVV
jgi:hypothetical protein